MKAEYLLLSSPAGAAYHLGCTPDLSPPVFSTLPVSQQEQVELCFRLLLMFPIFFCIHFYFCQWFLHFYAVGSHLLNVYMLYSLYIQFIFIMYIIYTCNAELLMMKNNAKE